MTHFFKARPPAYAAIAVLTFALQNTISAKSAWAQQPGSTFQGTVRDSSGSPISGATVYLEKADGARQSEASTDGAGHFTFSAPAGNYVIRVKKFGYLEFKQPAKTAAEPLTFNLSPADTNTAIKSASQMQFSDEPNFTVAGVTDWTAAGGHGSDVSLRTSEALAKETHKLEGATSIPPATSREDLSAKRTQLQQLLARAESADLHRQLGDIDEQLDDPLAAVQQYERATQLDPTEPNYFAWATELLLHRAISPSVEVFTTGIEKHPRSERLLVGLGAALYASGRYAQAAERVCAASDLDLQDVTPYLFLGQMVQVSNQPLPCSERRLERFQFNQPDNASANYFYAMALWKRVDPSDRMGSAKKVEQLLNKTVTLNPKSADAYLQLGILYAERGEPAKSIAAYQKAISSNPNLAEAHFRLAHSYKKAGEISKAQKEFDTFQDIQRTEAATLDQQRRDVRQFVVVFKDQP